MLAHPKLFFTTFVIIVILGIVMELLKITSKKATRIYVAVILLWAGCFAVMSIQKAIKDNPKVTANLEENYIQFKETEQIPYTNIKEVEYFENANMEFESNGYRWDNDKYFSGDASVKFLDNDGQKIKLIRRCKLYIDRKVNDYILVALDDSSKNYIFNLDNANDTKDFYNSLLEKVSEEVKK